jgi:hypothetical protein
LDVSKTPSNSAIRSIAASIDAMFIALDDLVLLAEVALERIGGLDEPVMGAYRLGLRHVRSTPRLG